MDNSTNFRPFAIMTAMGVLMAVGMVVLSLSSGDTNLSLDVPQDTLEMENKIDDNFNNVLALVVFDTFFVAAYTALFIGLYLITREYSEFGARIALIFGLLTSISDVFENSIQFALIYGFEENWSPDPLIFVLLWITAYFVNICAYIATLLFASMLGFEGSSSKTEKTLAILLSLFPIFGFLAYFSEIFQLLQSLLFVLGLLYGAIALFSR